MKMGRRKKPTHQVRHQKSPKPLSKRKYAFFLLTWTVLGAVFLVLALELILRGVGFGDDLRLFVAKEFHDGTKGYVPNPNVVKRYIFRPPHTDIREAGFFLHYDVLTDPKPETEIRIFFLGASTIHGLPHPVNLTITALLENLLKGFYPGQKIEVVNCSMTSINSYTLLDMAKEILPFEPDAVVIYSGHNEFYGPHGVASSVRLFNSRFMISLITRFTNTRIYQFVRKFDRSWRDQSGKSKERNMITMMDAMVGRDKIRLNSREYRLTLQRYRENVGRISDLLKSRDIPLVICAVVSNERDCGPLRSLLPKKMSEAKKNEIKAQLDQAWEMISKQNLEKAGECLSALRSLDPDGANLYFLSGRLAEAQGQYSLAREHYRKAIAADGMRFRAPPELNQLLLEIAEERELAFVDLERAFRQETENGILGLNMFVDHVHQNIRGKYIAANILPHVKSRSHWCRTIY